MSYFFKFTRFFLLLFILFMTLTPAADAARIVRVGWYNFGALSTYTPSADPRSLTSDEDLPGVYGGYNYEYLRMISQINGWQLRFVPGTINESLDRLQAGEIDLVGGVGRIPSREKKFAFPINSVLNTSIGLIARADDLRFTLNDLDSLHSIRVGAVADSNPLFRMQEWSRERSIPLQFVTYPSFEAMYAALNAGEVDAVTNSLIVQQPNRKILVSIESLGVYFIGNKNNPQLMQELDDAITQIQYLKPGYQEALVSKYLYPQSHSSFALSQKEQAHLNELIASGKPLQVSFSSSWFPIEYTDPETGEVRGIMADIFARISQLTGLKFTYITSPEKSSSAQIHASMSTDFSWADLHNSYLSQTVFDIPIFLVTHKEKQNWNTVAITSDSHLAESVKKRLAKNEPFIQYLRCSTTEECLNAVQEGRAGRTYINSYELNYYMNQNKFSTLSLQPVPGFNEAISIGVSKDEDPLLCSIICQALRSIPPAEINSIILQNITFKPPHSPLDFVYAYPLSSLTAVALLALLAGGLLFFYYSNKKNKRLRTELEDILQSRTSLLQANAELNHLSQYDALTGIPNRRGLDEFLNRVYKGSTHFILAMMDIDEFKKYNDTYGHLAGDDALVTVARLLRQHALDTGSFAARFGGEEFIWVDTIHTPSEVCEILEKLRKDLFDQHIVHRKNRLNRLTISIGCAVKHTDEPIETLIQKADEALYEAKNAGRNQLRCADEKS